jgi:anti-anti-sigma factor
MDRPSIDYSWIDGRYVFGETRLQTRGIEGADPVVRCRGELDAASADELVALLRELSERPLQSLLLDLSGVEFLDGHVVSVIAASERRLQRGGTALRVFAGGQPLRLLRLAGVSAKPASTERRSSPADQGP